MANNGGASDGRPIELHFTLEMDKRVVAKQVFEVGSLGGQFMKVRAIVGRGRR